jgi:hypothetical protein
MDGLDLYKELIDRLVVVSKEACATWVRRGKYPDTPKNTNINALLATLTDEQREVVAGMVQQTKVGGIHDAVREVLDEGGYQISKDGTELPFQPFGTESYFDYIARLAGDEWPKEA